MVELQIHRQREPVIVGVPIHSVFRGDGESHRGSGEARRFRDGVFPEIGVGVPGRHAHARQEGVGEEHDDDGGDPQWTLRRGPPPRRNAWSSHLEAGAVRMFSPGIAPP